jgi:tRNA threonylcarbamoyladenosine biosynthesis protein TsaB
MSRRPYVRFGGDMLVLTLRTDRPQAAVALFDDEKQLLKDEWHAHRQLAETLHRQIAKNLQFVRKEWGEIAGIVVYEGPGSFTGLRIGISVANALAYGLHLPVVATSGHDWQQTGLKQLQVKSVGTYVVPQYGSEPHITVPKGVRRPSEESVN